MRAPAYHIPYTDSFGLINQDKNETIETKIETILVQ